MTFANIYILLLMKIKILRIAATNSTQYNASFMNIVSFFKNIAEFSFENKLLYFVAFSFSATMLCVSVRLHAKFIDIVNL